MCATLPVPGAAQTHVEPIGVRVQERVQETIRAIQGLPVRTILGWGHRLGHLLQQRRRLFVAGNGGSGAQAQHLAAEMVGRYQRDRCPYSAMALSSDPCSLTAIGNDYDFDSVFSRQVEAHGGLGDILLCLSTSGASPNIVAAARTARDRGLLTWSLTGPAPNPLLEVTHEGIAVDSCVPAVVQEAHQVAVHLLCEAFEDAVGAAG